MKNPLKAFRRPAPAKYVTVVSGLPRSGTSMMMKMLEAGGLEPLTDHERVADEDNPKGYYEYERVKQLENGDNAWLAEAQGKVVKVVSAHLAHLPSTYAYRVIFVRRAIPEVLASQRKMQVRRGEDTHQTSDDRLRELYRRHLAEVEEWITLQKNVSVLYVSYNDMLENPAPDAERIAEFLDGRVDTGAMTGVVDPNLYRQRKK